MNGTYNHQHPQPDIAAAAFRAIFAQSPDAILVVDERSRIRLANTRAERLFGYRQRELLGRSVQILVPRPFRRRHAVQKMRYLSAPRLRPMGSGLALQACRKDGTEFAADIMLSPMTMGARRFVIAVVRDITERRRLQREVLEISERERRRIGQDLHDHLSQRLTATMLAGKILEERLARKSLPESALARQVSGLMSDLSAEVRQTAMGLFPAQLEREGLRYALKHLAQHTAQLSGIACVFRGSTGAVLPPPVDAIHLYRIAQEAVTNAVKHGRASRIEIRLRRHARQLVLTVRDNGRGLPKGRPHRRGLGLQSMLYRAALLGARINWQPAPQGGTVVTVRCQAT